MHALVFIPTYNEQENIENLINQILCLHLDISILVVDDNSSDGTGKIVDRISKTQPRLTVIHRFNQRGRGWAGIAGFKYAIKQNVDYIIEMDADFSHHPKYIPLFLEEIKDCDVVIGSRQVRGGKVIGRGLQRRCLTFLAQCFCRFVLGINILDVTSGFRCFRKCVLEGIDLGKLKSTGPSIVEEINFHLLGQGFKVKEVPIEFQLRCQGSSKLSLMKVLDAFFTLLRVRLAR